ncbi:MAG: alanine racemase [Gammaproteobacteria bacterium HGW-Gammaproteobacteria-3]|nr:MAG: alanine racemase [Gammaproteobacteria bacterium HGW-Gammaproteobacteria-3]
MKPAAYATLNLQAAGHNLAMVRRYAPDAKIMAVIKANAYGHGMIRIAKALDATDAFAVARVEEGIKLREAGIGQPITVLEGFTCALELAASLRYQLDAVVHCREQINLLAESLERDRINVWLKIDTGMNRLGFKPTEFAGVHQRLMQLPVIKKPINLMTHLASADDQSGSSTPLQLELFSTLTADYPGVRSIANSAGILRWRQTLTEWVRPGVMLYGISPFPERTGGQLGLTPIMGLYSRLIAVKSVATGESVGYGGSWLCQQPTRMGIVAIGYGDGYPRHAKPGTPVLINGRKAPLIGRVSMDMISVDLTGLPVAQVGDTVTLWGEGLPVEIIALAADTIPYALLCGITQRVQIFEE